MNRIVGRVNGNNYEVVYPDGSVMKSIPLNEAARDEKLKAAIQRNGWEALPE
jgi:hypothetical protein